MEPRINPQRKQAVIKFATENRYIELTTSEKIRSNYYQQITDNIIVRK